MYFVLKKYEKSIFLHDIYCISQSAISYIAEYKMLSYSNMSFFPSDVSEHDILFLMNFLKLYIFCLYKCSF